MHNASTSMKLWLSCALNNGAQLLCVLYHTMPISALAAPSRMLNGAVGTRFVPLTSGLFGVYDRSSVPIWREKPPDLLA